MLTFCCRPSNPTGALDPIPDARPLVVDEAYFEYADGSRRRRADRRRRRRRCARSRSRSALAGARIGYALAVARHRGRAERAARRPRRCRRSRPRSRSRRSRRRPTSAPVIEERERLADELRALGLRAARRRARTSSTSRSTIRLELADAAARRAAASCASSTRRSASPCATARTTTCSSTRSRALDRACRRRGAARHVRATDGDVAARPARARRREPRPRRDRGRASTTTSSSSSRSTAASTSCSRAAATLETGEHHTAEDAAHRARRGARPRARRRARGIARYGDAVVPMDDALARRRRRRSAAAAHTSIRARARPGPGAARAHELRRQRRASRPRRVDGPGRAPHRRGGVQGDRPRAARRAPPRERRRSRRRRARCEGRDLRATAPATSARSSSRCGGSALTSRTTLERADLAVLRASAPHARRWPACAREDSTTCCASAHAAGRPMLGICLGLQLALDESEEDGGVAGLGLVPGRAARLARGARAAHRLGDRRARRRGVLVRALVRGARRRRPLRRARASSPIVERGSFLGVQFHPEKSGAAGARASLRAMPLPRLIPCLDVAGGRVVKGVRFRGLRDVGDPVELGAAYSDARRRRARLPRRLGDGRVERSPPSASPLASPSSVAIPFTVGGGDSLRRRRDCRCSRRARTRSASTRRRSRGRS